MPIVVFLVLLAVPLIEISFLIKVGQVIGFWPTIGLLIAMAVLGSALLQRQGLDVMRKAADALAEGRPPVAAVIDSVFLVIAGLLFLTPGFLTDIVGLTLLIPPVRRFLANAAFRRLADSGDVQVRTYERRRWTTETDPGPRRPRQHPPADVVIETDYHRVDDTRDGRDPKNN